MSGPLNAGSFGPNAVDDTFGLQLVFQHSAPIAGMSPLAGYQFFGEVEIDGVTAELTVTLRDMADRARGRAACRPSALATASDRSQPRRACRTPRALAAAGGAARARNVWGTLRVWMDELTMPLVPSSAALPPVKYLQVFQNPDPARRNVDKTARHGQPSGRRTPLGRAEHVMAAPPDEQALMTAYAQGDAHSFEPLFRALAPRLLGFFRRSGLSVELSEDLVQATFVRLHQARDRYRPGAPVRPWLFTIAARVRIDHLRKQRRDRIAPELDVETLQADCEEPSPDEEQRAHSVRDALDALPPGLRVVVHLHRFEGLSFPEIGEVLGIAAGAARARAFRAYKLLRERLRPLLSEEP